MCSYTFKQSIHSCKGVARDQSNKTKGNKYFLLAQKIFIIIERLQVTLQYYVIHFRVAKPLVSLECYKSIWSVLVVRTTVLREIIKQ